MPIDTREAARFSLAGAETARLDLPLHRPLPSLTEEPAWLETKRRKRAAQIEDRRQVRPFKNE